MNTLTLLTFIGLGLVLLGLPMVWWPDKIVSAARRFSKRFR